MRTVVVALAALLLAACASYGGRGLTPGNSKLADVVRVMGEAAMRWQEPDGSVQLAYPRGPAGTATFMVRIGRDGKLQKIENVLESSGFAKILPGMSEAQVLQVLGPPEPSWTGYSKARDEQAWQWRYCDDWQNTARFTVLFDATSRAVRSTMSVPENCGRANCFCLR